jgi:hypothetical protein
MEEQPVKEGMRKERNRRARGEPMLLPATMKWQKTGVAERITRVFLEEKNQLQA